MKDWRAVDLEIPKARHVLDMKTFQCSCMEPWPCETRRGQLLDEYSGALYQLRMLMADYLTHVYATDLDIEVIRRQLVGWLPPRDRSTSASASHISTEEQ